MARTKEQEVSTLANERCRYHRGDRVRDLKYGRRGTVEDDPRLGHRGRPASGSSAWSLYVKWDERLVISGCAVPMAAWIDEQLVEKVSASS